MRLPAAFTGFRRHGCFCELVSLWRLLASHMAAQGSSWGAGVKLRTEAVATNSREEQIRIWNLCIARWREIKNGGTTSRGTSRRRSGGKRERQWWGARMTGGNCRTRYSRVRTVQDGSRRRWLEPVLMELEKVLPARSSAWAPECKARGYIFRQATNRMGEHCAAVSDRKYNQLSCGARTQV